MVAQSQIGKMKECSSSHKWLNRKCICWNKILSWNCYRIHRLHCGANVHCHDRNDWEDNDPPHGGGMFAGPGWLQTFKVSDVWGRSTCLTLPNAQVLRWYLGTFRAAVHFWNQFGNQSLWASCLVFSHFFRIRVIGTAARCLDFPLPRNFFQLFWVYSKVPPGDRVFPACLGSALGVSSWWDMPGPPR